MVRRGVVVAFGAALFGAVELRLARHSPAEFWFGNSSAAWLLLAFVAGAIAVRWRGAVALGLLATMVALSAFYVSAEHLDAAGLEFTEYKARWFVLGLASGPVFGLLGHFWRRTRSRWAALAVATPFLVEPAAWVRHRGHLPGPNAAWQAEVVLGVALLALLWSRVAADGRFARAEAE